MAVSSFTLLAVVALLAGVHCQFDRSRDQTLAECERKVMDIFFILDSSTSIYINDYRQEHQFVRDVVSRFDVSDTFTRVGMLTFSDDFTRPVLSLSRFQTKSSIISSVNEENLPYRTGVTNTDLAIRYVRESNEFREDITKVIVVITDGGSRSPTSTAREAILAREQGFYLFVVGVGQYLDEREWRDIASDPDADFIFNITNFRNLDSVRSALPSRACPLPPIIIGGSCGAQQRADLVFVAAPGGTQDAFQLIDNFVERSQDPRDFVEVSYLMEACTNAENKQLSDISAFCDRFANVGESDPNTYTDLVNGAREIFSANRQRRGAKQVAVLFVDEESMRINRFGLRNGIRALSSSQVEVVIVDLGLRQQYQADLRSMSNNYVRFTSQSISIQRDAMRRMLELICNAINRSFDINFTPV